MTETIAQYILQLNSLLGGNLGLTFIIIGVGVRLIFTPLLRKSMDQSQKMKELQPKLNQLKKKYKDDKTKLAQEQSKLFQESGINPAAGCLPMLVQAGTFFVLYNAISYILAGDVNTTFLGLNLATPDVIDVPGLPFPLPGISILLAGVSQLILSKLMMPQPVPVHKDDDKKEKEEKADLATEIANAQGQMVYLFPIMFVVLGYQFPAGLSIYWVASTITALFQQIYLTDQTWSDVINVFKPTPKVEKK